jgi:tripartite-type tricarboxylate transporter receptor subunit TctC
MTDENKPAKAGGHRLSRRAALGLLPALGAPAVARAQAGGNWPNRAVRYINPYPAGGPTDTLSRVYCTRLSEILGQQVVVENRSGSGGNIGVDVYAKAPPDGYTIGLGGVATHAIAPTLYRSLPFHPTNDFSFISGLWQLPNLLAVSNEIPARSVPELIELLKANPGKYSFGSAGSGTTLHLAGEMFKQLAGVDMLHVPYRGSAPAQVDLIAGRVSMMFDNMPGTLALSRQGQVRPLAVTSAARNPAAPDIPALSEFLPGFDVVSWTCVCGPAGIPAPILRRLSEASKKALEHPELVRFYNDLGATPWWTTPEDLASFRAAQQETLAPLIRASGAQVD